MTDKENKEKLIELLDTHCDYAGHVDCKEDCTACLADYLIANGVTFAKDTDVPSKKIQLEDRRLLYVNPFTEYLRSIGMKVEPEPPEVPAAERSVTVPYENN